MDKETWERLRSLFGYNEVCQPETWQLEKGKTKGKCSDIPVEESEPLDSFVPHVLARCTPSGSLSEQLLMLEQKLKEASPWIVLIEICTAFASGFSSCHLQKYHGSKLFVIQITRDLDIMSCSKELEEKIRVLKSKYHFKLVTWLSPPCTGGSPAQSLSQRNFDQRVADLFVVFKKIVRCSCAVFALGDIRILELSRYCRFWKSDLLRRFIEEYNINQTSYFDRCAYQESDGRLGKAKHTYRLQTNFSLITRKVCECESHASLSQQNLNELGSYPHKLTREVATEICRLLSRNVSFTTTS